MKFSGSSSIIFMSSIGWYLVERWKIHVCCTGSSNEGYWTGVQLVYMSQLATQLKLCSGLSGIFYVLVHSSKTNRFITFHLIGHS